MTILLISCVCWLRFAALLHIRHGYTRRCFAYSASGYNSGVGILVGKVRQV